MTSRRFPVLRVNLPSGSFIQVGYGRFLSSTRFITHSFRNGSRKREITKAAPFSLLCSVLICWPFRDGKTEVVVSSFVHYLEVLDGYDGDRVHGKNRTMVFISSWPSTYLQPYRWVCESRA